MYRYGWILLMCLGIAFSPACSTSYKATPMPFKTPAAYPNVVTVEGAQVGARAFVDVEEARKAFGFDIRGAGMLPVQVVFDNQGAHSIQINPDQTFLEDDAGNLWQILSSNIAYERATKYAQTENIFKEGAYKGFLGAAAGAIIGAAVGIVSGENVGSAIGKGAAIGGAAGATIGGVSGGYEADDARREIVADLNQKSLENKAIDSGSLAHGFVFFPGEATSAKNLRLQLLEKDTGRSHSLILPF